jgi:ATP-dependent RNA helicase SUPV3L1/SUV3
MSTLDASTEPPVIDEAALLAAQIKAKRARRRKAADALGWKLIGGNTAEIKAERTLQLGARTIVVRGRVSVPAPNEFTAEAGDRAVAEIIEPTVAPFVPAMERAAIKILSEPDDVAETQIYERSSFFTALEDARRGIVQSYQSLENKRVDEKVDAELGLRFYLEGFTTAERTFEYFVGPTNSGKTHAALEVLRAAESGIYLAPLRLLALEVYERLNELGAPASLVTGEERVINEAARYVSSTVEMVDLKRDLDVAVVDEAQMLEDPQRGWAWTLAIAGVRAKRVVLCGSAEGLHAARRLADRLGVTMTVRQFERKNPLRVVPAIALPQLRPGDAIVGFSRKAVVEMQGAVSKLGFTSAAIYGSLSPAVRRNEAERFRRGEADVLVATDAIGLGLNLPIRRLIFSAIEKFDGVADRLLTPYEIRQIAGRAGRYGLHEDGQVSALDGRFIPFLKRALEGHAPAAPNGPIWISPTDQHLLRLSAIIGTTRISRLLQFFQTRVLRDGEEDLRIADLSDTIEVAVGLELSDGFLSLPFHVRGTYSRAPVTTRGNGLSVLGDWGAQHAADGHVSGRELMIGGGGRDRLLQSEDRSRLAMLYLWLSQRFPDVYTNRDEVALIRETIDDDIHHALMERGTGPSKPRGRAFVKPKRRPPRPRDFGPKRRR